jgi:Domain of unknown function (DUF4390)
MRYYKKTSILLCLFFLVLFSVPLVWAAGSSLSIKSAELVAADDAYLLNADFELNLSSAVEEAINKGVPLNFLIEFQITSPRRYWFDHEIVTVTSEVTVSYHALSRQYLINRDNHQQSFASLQEAKAEFSHLRDWQVIDKALLQKGDAYQAALRVRLDQSKLPKPLQVDALGSEDWNMISERYRWVPTFVFQ